MKSERVEDYQLPWQPINTTISIPRLPPQPDAAELEERRQRRDDLAANAQARYEEWHASGPPPRPQPNLSHPNDHRFRDRTKAKELAGEWASADQVLHERDRVNRAVRTAESTYLRHPPYPKQGGGVKNVEFSFMSSGYDYRLRQPSKEVAGTWSILRVKPFTESARINEAAARNRPYDTLGGGRWTVDGKYGNPVTFSPTTTGGLCRRLASPDKWMAATSPPATAPGGRKWRGGFATDFPPRSAKSGTSAKSEPIGEPVSWLHHTESFVDRSHDTVAVHHADTNPAFRPKREKRKELTGGDGRHQFWPQSPVDVYVPNPSLTCTWNQITPPSPLPPRTYLKSGGGTPRGLDEPIAEVVQSGVGSGSG